MWSDGWLEQGGNLVVGGNITGGVGAGKDIELLKPYSDTNYNLQTNALMPGGDSTTASHGNIVSTTQIRLIKNWATSITNQRISWYTCGQS